MKFVGYAAAAAIALTACHGDSITAPSDLSTPTCGPASLVTLSVNQAATLACTSGTFINLAGGAKYLIVPQLASGGLQSGIPYRAVSYQIGVPASAAHALSPVYAPSASLVPAIMSGSPAAPLRGMQQQFDAALRRRARLALSSGHWQDAAPATPRARANSISAAVVPAAGSLRNFQVLSGTSLASASFTTATARLAFVGTNLLVYIDTVAPANGFTDAQLQAFSQYFDQTLYPIDIAAFGQPADIDGNGRVIMLLSPTVNALTTTAQCNSSGFVAGYFDGLDFSASANSNQGEIFYGLVPDPNGTLSCAHPVTDLLTILPATFLHELQHLISFSQHVSVRHGQPEEGWLDEGMSIRAEELGSEYFEAKFPPPSGRANPAQLFPDSSQGFIAGMLGDSYAYLQRSDTASLTLHTDADNGLQWRGGDWLLLHWLGDLKGKAVYTALEHGTTTGIANIAAAAGESFGTLFGDFSLMPWTDSIVGEPRSAIPVRDRLQSRNLRQLYARLSVTSGVAPYPFSPTVLTTTAPVSATLVPGSMAFYLLDLSSSATSVAIQFAAPGGTALSTTFNPQVSIYRLP
jgi:hypothetical protein